ncbi:MAG: TAXI family TRAP transporter solute-binding subunit [Pseudomonadota bacterium]|nr:TAXI family TRAP transporter solute-binding subunit [Pseudomonadota bacterium]
MFRHFRLPALAAVLGLAVTSAYAQPILTAETASPGGPPYMSITNLSNISAAAGIADLQVRSGLTLTDAVLDVADGKAELANGPLILVFMLSKGVGPFAAIGAEKGAELASNLRALYPYNLGGYTMFSYDSTGFAGWDDLSGRTIYNGPPAGGALVGARQLMQIVGGVAEGDDYKGIQVNWGQSGRTISDGSADVFVLPESHPSQRIITTVAAGRVTIQSVPKDMFESEAFRRWATSPGNAPVTIPVEQLGYDDDVTVATEDGIWRSVNITGAELVNKDVDADVVKAMVAEYIRTMDTLKTSAPYAVNMGIGVIDAELSGFCGPNPLKYHPGAIAAWEEAGYTIPECAKP